MDQIVYLAQSRLAGSVLDVWVTPARIEEILRELDLCDVQVKMIPRVQHRQAFALWESGTVYFTAAAMTMPIVLHEIAHLVSGPEHDTKFIAAYCELVARFGGCELAEELRAEMTATGLQNAR